ncbi:MAG: hypothetical protein OXG60_07090 [Chloroflexi bacterium]|nr:hypothetical protein [Chloroflexota bacterium]
MSDIVVDTNVWVMVDKKVSELEENEDRNCVRSCQVWLERFIIGEDRLVVDSFNTYAIISEYRRNVMPGGIAENLLNELVTVLFDRLLQLEIQLDENGYAELPNQLMSLHGKDRKFVAVAIQCVPYAPIVNATDTDWAQEKQQLADTGVTVQELCPEYIEAKLSRA